MTRIYKTLIKSVQNSTFFLPGYIVTHNPNVGLDVTVLGQTITVSEITLGLNVTPYETTLIKSKFIADEPHLYCLLGYKLVDLLYQIVPIVRSCVIVLL